MLKTLELTKKTAEGEFEKYQVAIDTNHIVCVYEDLGILNTLKGEKSAICIETTKDAFVHAVSNCDAKNFDIPQFVNALNSDATYIVASNYEKAKEAKNGKQ